MLSAAPPGTVIVQGWECRAAVCVQQGGLTMLRRGGDVQDHPASEGSGNLDSQAMQDRALAFGPRLLSKPEVGMIAGGKFGECLCRSGEESGTVARKA